MRILRVISGISLFCASGWLAPAVSDAFGISQILGFFTVGGVMAFLGGVLFHSGLRRW